MSDKIKNPEDYISPFVLATLKGRVLNLPAKTAEMREKNILFIYGHHSSLERWWGLIQAYSKYGNIIAPDLPGFGGMDSLYKIGKKPTVDNLADYLAQFIDKYYKDKQLIICAMSFGFVIATRMLQRHPDLVKQVKIVVSIVGFADKSDFSFTRRRRQFYITTAKLFSGYLASTFFRYIILNTIILKVFYARMHNARNKFSKDLSKSEFNHLMDVEIGLWHDNDVRTYLYTTIELLTIENANKKVNLPLQHVYAKNDHFFNNKSVIKHLSYIYEDFHAMPTDLVNHAPSVIADEAEAAALISPELNSLLLKI